MKNCELNIHPDMFPNLKLQDVEPEGLSKPRTLHGAKYQHDDLVVQELRGAGTKGARRKVGRIPFEESGPVCNGNSAIALYTTKGKVKGGAEAGKIIEQDIRSLDVNESRERSVTAAQRKEAILFRMNVIQFKAGVRMRKEDKAVVKRMASLMIEDRVSQEKLCEHNPYQNKNYIDLWNTWALRIAVMKFKTPSIH